MHAMQLRFSFVLLGIAAAGSARPIVVPPSSQVLTTDLASTSTSAFASASTSPHTIITPVSVLDAREIYVPYLEDRSPAVAAPLITRAAKDPSSQIEEAYESHATSSPKSRAETRGNVESGVPIYKRDFFEWMGEKAGKVTHNPGLQQIGGGFKTIGGEIGNKAKEEGQKAKNAYNNAGASAGSAQPQPQPQRRQEANPNVENSSLVQSAEAIAKKQQQMKEGANRLKHMITNPFHEAHDQMVNGAKNIHDEVVQKKNDAVNGAKKVEESTVNGVEGAANSVANAGKGAANGLKGAVNGAEQGYKEGSNAGNPPAPPA
ncbi:hypothetical protein F5879DRAFT_987034 [Lentinula edodes]|nr:uncharacterized protein C8R40DRAFT_1172340 [Lentinula edodes]KAF8831133.1 hypothetical protein HHX47_DHR1000324 [Lentinula edodes]KAH7873554.1 hypothetical protein C8R40DRAFT_1172340 [Lentinula edodes]KAJ3906864.1 hypothetical protein F5879DRAFT_987034 [Lentinula edodes]